MYFEEIVKALGWQGGTIHQVLSEIKRLKEVEKSFKSDNRNELCEGCKKKNKMLPCIPPNFLCEIYKHNTRKIKW